MYIYNTGRGSIHFDNIINGILAIFQVMTLEGWADLLYEVGLTMLYRRACILGVSIIDIEFLIQDLLYVGCL